MADPTTRIDFEEGATGWRVITDQVMGGVSEGRAALREEAGQTYLELTGSVSTANNGGFVQVRYDLPKALAKDAEALHLRVKGDGQLYFIHLKTRGAVRPWHYYQAPFEAAPYWQDITRRMSRWNASPFNRGASSPSALRQAFDPSEEPRFIRRKTGWAAA